MRVFDSKEFPVLGDCVLLDGEPTKNIQELPQHLHIGPPVDEAHNLQEETEVCVCPQVVPSTSPGSEERTAHAGSHLKTQRKLEEPAQQEKVKTKLNKNQGRARHNRLAREGNLLLTDVVVRSSDAIPNVGADFQQKLRKT